MWEFQTPDALELGLQHPSTRLERSSQAHDHATTLVEALYKDGMRALCAIFIAGVESYDSDCPPMACGAHRTIAGCFSPQALLCLALILLCLALYLRASVSERGLMRLPRHKGVPSRSCPKVWSFHLKYKCWTLPPAPRRSDRALLADALCTPFNVPGAGRRGTLPKPSRYKVILPERLVKLKSSRLSPLPVLSSSFTSYQFPLICLL